MASYVKSAISALAARSADNKDSKCKLKIPKHIAFIMDGNGRWAQARGLPRSAGHKAGLDRIQTVLRECYEKGVKIVSVFAWSTENWSRPQREVSYVMRTLEKHLPRLVKALHEENVRFVHIGSMDRLSIRAQEVLGWACNHTRNNGPFTFNLAFNYGGRDDILHALRKLISQKVPTEKITEAMLDEYLYTSGIPDVDLLIRSGGEKRISNFMLWQIATAYIYFTDTFWPDMGEREIHEAIKSFDESKRCRTNQWS
jgi:undecaprenyl diphosphate synthase